MEEISFTPADSNSGVFKSGSGKPKRYSAFSKFFETGFEILHIGINVPHSVFIQQMKKFSPHVLVLVCQGNVDGIKELIETIKKEEMRSMARIILYERLASRYGMKFMLMPAQKMNGTCSIWSMK